MHSLRGACAVIGAVGLQQTLQGLENGCADDDARAPAEAAEALAGELRDLINQLSAQLAR